MISILLAFTLIDKTDFSISSAILWKVKPLALHFWPTIEDSYVVSWWIGIGGITFSSLCRIETFFFLAYQDHPPKSWVEVLMDI